jgi:hypothetical protein
MFTEQKHSMSATSWYPIQSSPSEDMWELPSSTPTSSSTVDSTQEEHDFQLSFDDDHNHEDNHRHENFSIHYPDNESHISVASNEDMMRMVVNSRNEKRKVLADATNTLPRKRNQETNAGNTTRRVRRSQFS